MMVWMIQHHYWILCVGEERFLISSEHLDHMFIRFSSDHSIEFAGFNATVRPVDGACTPGRPRVITREGDIFSPNYPENYPDNTHCAWLVDAQGSGVVELVTHDFQTENCCTCDYLEVFDGEDTSAPRF